MLRDDDTVPVARRACGRRQAGVADERHTSLIGGCNVGLSPGSNWHVVPQHHGDLPFYSRSFHRHTSNQLIRYRILKIGLFRYWTQTPASLVDEATVESNHKRADCEISTWTLSESDFRPKVRFRDSSFGELQAQTSPSRDP